MAIFCQINQKNQLVDPNLLYSFDGYQKKGIDPNISGKKSSDLSKLTCTEQNEVVPSYSPSEKNLKLYESRLQATPKIARAIYVFVLSLVKFYQFDLKPIL